MYKCSDSCFMRPSALYKSFSSSSSSSSKSLRIELVVLRSHMHNVLTISEC